MAKDNRERGRERGKERGREGGGREGRREGEQRSVGIFYSPINRRAGYINDGIMLALSED